MTKQDINIALPVNYRARPYQVPFWEAGRQGYKRFVLVWHRRAGKEKTCWNYLIMQACKKVGIYYYFFPHFSQGRKILWDGVDKDGFRLLKHLPDELIDGNPNSTEMKIRLKNGSLIQIIGTNNIDSIVGTNPIGCVFTEYSLQDPKAWQLIRPILTENGGWAVFNYTPRGANHGKEIYDMAKKNEAWFSQLLTVDDTDIITAAQIDAERQAGMSEDFIQQEFYCSFTLGVEGSYYAKYLEEAREEGRVGNVPWDQQNRVYTAWDLGYGDSTAIIFYQVIGQEIHIIDYYENHGEGLPHYAGVLKEKKYIYADHFAPHDIESHAFSSGLSAREVGANLGIRFITLPTLKLRLEDGIEALRGIFPRIWVNEPTCGQLLKCLGNYRKEFDDRLEVYKNRPLHDKYSHGCFIGETLIDTIHGKVRIDQIRVGDLVRTPSGYKKVLKLFCYDSKDLIEVTTTSSKLVCTPQHNIFTEIGLIHAGALRYNVGIYRAEDAKKCQMLFGSIYMEPSIGFRDSFLSARMDFRSSLTGTDLGGMVGITAGGKQVKTSTKNYIGAFGRLKTAQSLTGIISTMWTMTPRTTAPKTWYALVQANIRHCMVKLTSGLEVKRTKNNSPLFHTFQKTGTPPKRGASGTEDMLKNRDLDFFQALEKSVSVAVRVLRLETHGKLYFVHKIAEREAATCRVSTMLPEHAESVTHPLQSIDTQLKERVLKIVPLNFPVLQKVYDFEVEKDHCYYANDLLVSNSDAARYMAIAIKRHVDAAKSSVGDDQADQWYEKHNPRFN